MIVVVTSFYRTQAMSSFLFFSYLLHFNCKFVMMKNYFKGRHFQKDIILVAVGYYLRFSLSYRDLVEILRDRGIAVHQGYQGRTPGFTANGITFPMTKPASILT